MKLPYRILVIDDDEHTLSGIVELLRDAGHHVTGAATYDAAKRLMAVSAFDLLITDVRLRSYNGLRLVSRDVAARINLAFTGMAHASELEQVLTQPTYRLTEYPVHVLYTEYSRSKGQPLQNSVNILGDILVHRVSTWSRA